VTRRFERPNVEAPLIVWEYAMTLEQWVINAEERLVRVVEAAEPLARLPYPVSTDERTDWLTYQQRLRHALTQTARPRRRLRGLRLDPRRLPQPVRGGLDHVGGIPDPPEEDHP